MPDNKPNDQGGQGLTGSPNQGDSFSNGPVNQEGYTTEGRAARLQSRLVDQLWRASRVSRRQPVDPVAKARAVRQSDDESMDQMPLLADIGETADNELTNNQEFGNTELSQANVDDPVAKARAVSKVTNESAVNQNEGLGEVGLGQESTQASPVNQAAKLSQGNGVPQQYQNRDEVQKAKELANAKQSGATDQTQRLLDQKLPPDAKANLQKAKQDNSVPKSGDKKPGIGSPIGNKLGNKGEGAPSSTKIPGMGGSGGMSKAGGMQGIDPNQAQNIAKKAMSGDLTGALKEGGDVAKLMALERLYDASLRAVAYFGLGILGMEAVVIAGKFLGVKITWWKRWLVHAINLLIVIILLLILVFIIALFASICKAINESWFIWGLMQAIRIGELFSGTYLVASFDATCKSLLDIVTLQ